MLAQLQRDPLQLRQCRGREMKEQVPCGCFEGLDSGVARALAGRDRSVQILGACLNPLTFPKVRVLSQNPPNLTPGVRPPKS